MLMWLKILSDVLIACGAFFALVGVLGILRMPDTFCRMQASTCVSTLGVIGVALGGLLHAIFAFMVSAIDKATPHHNTLVRFQRIS